MSQVLLNGHQASSQVVLDLLRRIAEFFNRDVVVLEANNSHVRFLVLGLPSTYVMMRLRLEALNSPSGWGIGDAIRGMWPQGRMRDAGIREMWPQGRMRAANRNMHVGGGCAPYLYDLAGGGLVICESGGSLVLESNGQSDLFRVGGSLGI